MISARRVSKRENPTVGDVCFEIPKLAFAHYVQIRTHQYARNARCRLQRHHLQFAVMLVVKRTNRVTRLYMRKIYAYKCEVLRNPQFLFAIFILHQSGDIFNFCRRRSDLQHPNKRWLNHFFFYKFYYRLYFN